MVHRLLKLRTGAVQMSLDRVERQPEEIACLRIGEALEIGKHQNSRPAFAPSGTGDTSSFE
jgi:hypothetical protein